MTDGMSRNSRRITAVVDFIHHHFIWMIIASYGLAAVMPSLGLWMREVKLATVGAPWHTLEVSLPLIMLAALLFNAGLGVKIGELRHLLAKPQVLLLGVLGNVATPLTFIIAVNLVMGLWHNPEEVQQILVGLALVAAMPIAGASTAWVQNANGSLVLSLGLVLVTTALSPLLTPMVFHTVGAVTTGDYSEDLHELASGGVLSFLGAWVILPSLFGIFTHWIIGEQRIAAVKPHLKLINYGVLVLLNYSNASLTLPRVIAQPDLDFLLIMLVIVITLCLMSFMTGYVVALVTAAKPDERVSLVFGLGMNNNGTGLVLASVALADHPEVMLPVIFYTLVQHLVAAAVDCFVLQRGTAELAV